MDFNLFGKKVSITNSQTGNKDHSDILSESIKELIYYRDASKARKEKVVENEKWFRSLHWDLFRSENYKDSPEPSTNYLMSNILNKHADMMDSYPRPNLLPREHSDEQLAKQLSSILPLIFEQNEYKNTYSQKAYTKLKQGYAIESPTWNTELLNGLGDIQINEIDLTSIFFEPAIKHIQYSKSVYVVSLIDTQKLKKVLEVSNPEAASRVGASNILQIEKYPTVDTIDYTRMTLMIDKYYKANGKVHYMKFIEGAVLYWTEDPVHGDKFADGLYSHGMYPFVFDVLIPETGTVYGIGFIDIMKNPQMYIDKFDQIMLDNLLKAGKKRHFIRDNSSVNEEDLVDWSKEFVRVSGSVDEANIREISVSQLDPAINNYRQTKINELKEVSNTNEFSRGESGKGVTAYRAIAALQEASNKVSRDMIAQSYESYRQLCVMVVEVVRQFYDAPRMFRITNDEGVFEYQQFNNASLKANIDPILGTMSKAEFDISISAERHDPFNQAATNELMLQLYGMGFFHPQKAEEAMIALEMMQFEGKEKIKKMIKEGSQLMMQVQAMMQENMKLKAIVQEVTGANLGVPMNGQPQEGDMRNGQNNDLRQQATRGRGPEFNSQ